jgi:rhodanese-related sulfurtransferase
MVLGGVWVIQTTDATAQSKTKTLPKDGNMAHSAHGTFIALPLGLLLAGCAGGEKSEVRTSIADREAARSTRSHVSRPGATPAPRSDQILGYRIAPESRYDVTLDEMRGHLQNNSAVFVDARSPAAFARGHVRGAVNLPAGQMEAYFGPFSQSVTPDQLIILYCGGAHCGASDMVYEYLASRGYTNMRIFRPGWDTLSTAGDLR